LGNFSEEGRNFVFIVRLMRMQGIDMDSAPAWRALLEDANTRQRLPIRDMSALQALLAPYADELDLGDFLDSE
jgi:hypothetical protein